MKLVVGNLYFLKDEYYQRFNDPDLQRNKEPIDGKPHDRPFYLVVSASEFGIYWVVPVSSQVEKYHTIAERMLQRYGRCDVIKFAHLFGEERVFLIQNMCPVTEEYIKGCYFDKGTNIPAKLIQPEEREIIKAANKALRFTRNGKKLILPDSIQIENALLNDK